MGKLTLNERLPNKPSELLRVALNDLKAAERDPRYTIDMTDWHVPRDKEGLRLFEGEDMEAGSSCAVCLAGSVMRQSFDGNYKLCPDDFTLKISGNLEAIDCLRRGQVEDAYYHLGRDKPVNVIDDYEGIPEYDEGKRGFYKAMDGLIKYLEHFGE